MRRIFYFCVFLSFTGIFAQDVEMFRQSISSDVIAADYYQAKRKVYDYVEQNGFKVERIKDSSEDIDALFYIEKDQYPQYMSFLKELGYVDRNDVTTESWANEYEELLKELQFLQQKKESYDGFLKNNVSSYDEKYAKFWREIRDLEENIFNKEQNLERIKRRDVRYVVHLKLRKEATASEMSVGSVRFVNMPGVEYSWLMVENPKKDLSASVYQGYFVKYLFTRGKSFFSLGAYKNKKSENGVYNEMFLLGFGQDFYSRYLGRGHRRFLNLYSGYTIGGSFMSRDADKEKFFYLQPSIGLELYKNKYILVDTKVGYFLPIHKQMNTNFRGVSYNFSFNFVF